MKIYLALDVTHDEGHRITGEDLLTLVEDDGIADTVEDGDSCYRVKVLGVARTAKDLQDSIKRRRAQS